MDVTDKDFEEKIIKSELPVLIEFWASWCIPCKQMEWLLNELEDEYKDKVNIAKLNVDRNRKIPTSYNITGIPTFMMIKDGEVLESVVGSLSKKDLKKMINRVIK